MAQQVDSLTKDADGSETDNIFKLPPVIVTGGTTDRFPDTWGTGNIFDYGTGTISSNIGNVTFGGGGAINPPTTTAVPKLTVSGVYEQVFNDELDRINAIRAKQGLGPLTNLDKDQEGNRIIDQVADFAVSQVGKIYDDAQRDLDRTQAARQIAQVGPIVPIPLPVSGTVANILNAAELASLISNVASQSNLNVATPQTPQEVVEAGGNLSQIGTVPAATNAAIAATQTGSPVTGLLGGVLGAATGIFSGPVAAPAGGYPGLSSTSQQTTTSTNPLVITTGATGGETTGTGSSTPSVTDPAGTTAGTANQGLTTQQALGVLGQVQANVGKVGTSTIGETTGTTSTTITTGTQTGQTTSTSVTTTTGGSTGGTTNQQGGTTATSVITNTGGQTTGGGGTNQQQQTTSTSVITTTGGGGGGEASKTTTTSVITGTTGTGGGTSTTDSGKTTATSVIVNTGGGGGGGGGSTGTTANIFFTLPTSTATTMPTNPAQRNILTEGTTTSGAFTELAPKFAEMYSSLAGKYQDADLERLVKLASEDSDFAKSLQNLTNMATQQTIASNAALRQANIDDVYKLGGGALLAKQYLNPELYGSLHMMTQLAEQQAGADYEKLQQAGQLSAEDIRNAQQAAREAYGARGQVYSPGAIGAEILNRQALQQQRQQLARQNYQQSLGNLGAATQMQTANAFDPFSTILGQQYGMQTQNVGTTQGLFGQAGALTSGGMSYAPVVQTYNPFGVYPADVYGTNVNAINAAQIAQANRDAALQAANLGQTGDYAKALGAFLGSPTGGNVLSGIGNIFTRMFGIG